MNEEKIWLQQKGHFSHPGQKGRCLSTTRGLSVHVPEYRDRYLLLYFVILERLRDTSSDTSKTQFYTET